MAESSKKKAIEIEDIRSFAFLSSLKANAEGDICFVVTTAKPEEDGYASNLYLRRRSGETLRLTAFDGERSFAWSADGDSILFPALRTEAEKQRAEAGEDFSVVYRISTSGGEAVPAFSVPFGVERIRALDDSRFILLLRRDLNKPNLEGLSESERADALRDYKKSSEVDVIEEIPFWSNGSSGARRVRRHLALYNASTDRMSVFGDDFDSVGDFDLSPDRSMILFTSRSYDSAMPVDNRLMIAAVEEHEIVRPVDVTPDAGRRYGSPRFLDEGRVVYLASDMRRFGLNEDTRLYRLDVSGDGVVTGPARLLSADDGLCFGNSVGSDVRYGRPGEADALRVHDGWVYLLHTDRYSSGLIRFDGDGNEERIISRQGTVDFFDLSDEGVTFAGLRDRRLQELYLLPRSSGAPGFGEEERVSTFNEAWYEDHVILDPLYVDSGAEDIDGWVILPPDATGPVPAILNIHGGPRTAYGDVFYHEMQAWAQRGFAVMFCNPHGSDGRGNEFADIRGRYGSIDYDDIMAFVDRVLQRFPDIDGSRLCVTGGSYGGFMTNWIIGHNSRFVAAAAQRSISNWTSMWGTSDIGYYFETDQMAAHPIADYETTWRMSPLAYASEVTTPTLFIHSDEDYRCWVPEAYQMFTALKERGVDARLCVFHGENHELSRSGKPRLRIRRLREIIEWFERYAGVAP